MMKNFNEWWSEDGSYIDPDTADVPWFDKRRGLAEAAFSAGMDEGVNYVFDNLALALGLTQWVAKDGSESWDGDVYATLMGILYDAKVLDPEDNSRIATPASGERNAVVEAAARDVLAERERQKTQEGWTPEHDDGHTKGELAKAAACYAYGNTQLRSSARLSSQSLPVTLVSTLWPWGRQWWKPTDRRRDLVKAGALILAEIERLDRAALKETRNA
jgi:hypothetical protein